MIISRCPVRISLGGGGTDLASYYSQHGGFLIAGAINKYISTMVNNRFYKTIRLGYSKTEIVDSVDEIEHPIFRECLKTLDVLDSVEIVTVADVPANCGLGTSSAFTVSLLNALHAYKREFMSLGDLAEEACKIEIDQLGEPIGKQDQYMAAFGGLTCLTFERDGTVHVEPLEVGDDVILELQSRILLFYTGMERRASDILAEQNASTKQKDTKTVETLHTIKEIGMETRRAFEGGDIDRFGELLDTHWQTKKKLSSKVSHPFIDECYELARKNGALGGKIMGAGGGGFFLFYCPQSKNKLITTLQKAGLRFMPFQFDFDGAKIVANMRIR